MQLIPAIEFQSNGCRVRVISQIRVEKAIVEENLQRFQLAHTIPLFKKGSFFGAIPFHISYIFAKKVRHSSSTLYLCILFGVKNCKFNG